MREHEDDPSTGKRYQINGVSVFECPATGPVLGSERDAVTVIGEAFGTELVVIPVARFEPAFFDLATRRLGEFVQKFVNYHLRLAIVGDISAYQAGSKALRDYVYESNRVGRVLFLASSDELAQRL